MSHSDQTDSSRPAAGTRTFWVWTISVGLLVLVGVVFGQVIGHQFIGFDDNGFVYENPHVTPGVTLSGIWWALTDGPFGEWCPLTAISHMLDCQCYGLEPAGHYLTNVLLHAASSVVLFWVLLRMTQALWPSAWVAAVFAVHPLHVESVAWLAERRDVLSGLFFMLTLGAYALYAERPSWARYLAVALLFALGLASKPMLVTVPCLLLLLDVWPLDRYRRAGTDRSKAARGKQGRVSVFWWLVAEKIPLFALSAATCVITLVTHLTKPRDLAVEPLPLAMRLTNAVVSYVMYLSQSFYPIDLAPHYPHAGTHPPTVLLVGSLALLITITAVAVVVWRRWPFLPVGWFWFLGMLVPVSGIVLVSGHARADRYTYLSQIGLSIAVAWSVWSVCRSPRTERWQRWILAAASTAAVLALTAVAWRQASYWRDAETIWRRTIACTQRNVSAHYGLALALSKQGRSDEVIDAIRAGLADNSAADLWVALSHTLLASQLEKQGTTDEALTQYEQAVSAQPLAARFHQQFASALTRAGQPDRAIAEWRETLRLAPRLSRADPDLARILLGNAHVGLAESLLAAGNADDAIAECREFLGQDPNAIDAIATLGAALASQGRFDEAIPHLRRVVELDPKRALAHFRLGLAQYERSGSKNAVAELDEAIHLAPDNVPMLWQTAWILATSPDPAIRDGARAVDLARRAARLTDRQEPRVFDALAAALAENGDFPAALDAAEQASTIALTQGDDTLVDAISARARLYRQGLPYHQAKIAK